MLSKIPARKRNSVDIFWNLISAYPMEQWDFIDVYLTDFIEPQIEKKYHPKSK